MFTKPIYSGYSGHTLIDPGAQHQAGAPVICTEFGGVNIAPAKDAKSGERDWGYTTASDAEDFLTRFEKLVMGVVKGGHACGLVYTQLYVFAQIYTCFPISFLFVFASVMRVKLISHLRCDIEQEVNGLYSYDRRDKVPVDRIKAIMDAARDYYYQHVGVQPHGPKGFKRLLEHGRHALHIA